MTKPFGVGCHCGFMADTPQAFLDHCLVTGHVFGDVDLTETGALSELGEVIATLQHAAAAEAAGEPVTLPEGMEINALSVEDILTDDTLSDEQKDELLTRWEELKQRLGEDD